MKNEIIDIIYQISTEQGGIYSALFGFEGFDIIKKININYVIDKTDLKESIKTYLDYIIAQILQHSSYTGSANVNDKTYNVIVFNSNIYTNPFIDKLYTLNVHTIFDFENYLNNINIIDIGDKLHIQFDLPIYKID